MSNVDWILITLVRAISRVRANNAILPPPPPPFPPLQPSPPSDQAFCACFACATEAEYNTKGNFGRKKSERGKKKKKSDLSRFSLHLAIELRITTNKSDKSWLDVIKH